MKRRGGILLASAVTLAAALASTAGAGSTTAGAQSQAISCKSTMKIALLAPFTGGAAFLGTEQLSWAKYAVKTLPEARPQGQARHRRHAGRAGLRRGGRRWRRSSWRTEGASSPCSGRRRRAPSPRRARRFQAAGIAHISPSATRTTLTKGGKEADAFFRDIPGDYIQGPSDANFMINNLHVKKVVIIDFQEPYSLGLADAVETVLKAKGVDDDPALGSEHDDRLLVLRDEGAERRGHRLLPDAEAG